MRNLKITISLPAWVMETDDFYLRSVAEDVYFSKGLAEFYGAKRVPACQPLLRAAEKSLRNLEDSKVKVSKRCAEGDRAARKYWEAKVCAREKSGKPSAGLGSCTCSLRKRGSGHSTH